MKRGQMEIIGLVFVVIIIILGLLLYLRFSASDSARGSRILEVQGARSFLVALSEMTVTEYHMSFAEVASLCAVESPPGPACSALRNTMTATSQFWLEERGVSYNLSLENKVFVATCESANPSVDTVGGALVPIVHPGGAGTSDLTIIICQ